MDELEREFYIRLGQKIRTLRRCYGLKQKDLADKLNISKSYMCEIEHGKKIVSSYRLHEIKILLPSKTIKINWSNY